MTLGRAFFYHAKEETGYRMTKFSAPRGTQDILPTDSYKWLWAESIFREICRLFGYSEIRTPTFEDTELFNRSIGEATDIVSKEMYTFTDRGGRSITLRPEGTAPAIRAYVEHNLGAKSPVTKLYYITSIFRYERPQAGRFREHHQFGIECVGSDDPAVDAEVISLGREILGRVGLVNWTLRIGSVGCKKCRANHRAALRESLKPVLSQLCGNCQRRYDLNPLRILDCKEDQCKRLTENAPSVLDYLDDECKTHFDLVRGYLGKLGIPYTVDRRLVRGLDYYTRTAFEFVGSQLGAQSQIIGGGRYDDLVEELGGHPTPAIGFGMGIERLLMSIEAEGIKTPSPPAPAIFVAVMGDDAKSTGVNLLYRLRSNDVPAEMDYSSKSLKAQMKLADKLGVKYTLILGEDELRESSATIRNMQTKEQKRVPISDVVEKLSEEYKKLSKEELCSKERFGAVK